MKEHTSRLSFLRFGLVATISASFLLLLLFKFPVLSAQGQSTAPAAIQTIVSTHITTDTVWTLAGSPYEVTTDIQIYPVATLTVEPGVVVKFAQQAGLDVRGKIVATGTLTQSILFTGSTQQPGWWDGISIIAPTAAVNTGSIFNHVTIEYGGNYYANLYFFKAQAEINHIILRNSSKAGLYTQQSEGIDLKNASFIDNAGDAIYMYDFSGQSHYDNITATGPGINAIVMRSALIESPYTIEDVGLPYHIEEYMSVYPGGVVTIEPGVEMAFANGVTMDMRGILKAVGTQEKPILFTGIQKIRGGWNGIFIQGLGGSPNHGSVLEYVTLEYGGSVGANLRLLHASARINNSIIRQSAQDGIRVDVGASDTWIDSSAIVQNSGFGVNNTDLFQPVVIASGNWWGSPTGPRVAENCNEAGTGSLVSANVEFAPFLTEADEQLSTVAPLDVHQISISPQRWYVPADDVTQAEVILILRNGEGNPIAGQPVFLHSTLGDVLTGGITNAFGQARARVKSNIAGEALLTASVTRDLPCTSDYRSGKATIRFTDFASGALEPGALAPYMDGALQFSPQPVVQGVSTEISAEVTNPNPYPIYVNGNFSIFQSGIAVAFAPVGSVQNVQIPANSKRVISVDWVPQISGYYCIRFEYNWSNAPSGSNAAEGTQSGKGTKQKNLKIYNPESADKKQKENYDKAIENTKKVDSFLEKIPIIKWFLKSTNTNNENLKKDPPRQDYSLVSVPEPATLAPIVAGNGISAAQAAALTKWLNALNMADAHAEAALIAFDRYGGAAAANDMRWASVQMQELNSNKSAMASDYIAAADAVKEYLAVLEAENVPDEALTLEQLQARQEALAADGYSDAEIALTHAAGFTDEEIAAILEDELAWEYTEGNPSLHAGLADLEDAYRSMAAAILFPPTFGHSVSGGAGLLAAELIAAGGLPPGFEEPPLVPATNNLARVYEMTTTINIGNPKTAEATIDLRLLPIDLPAGWTADVTPDQVTLDAGEETTAIILLTPQGPSVQGTSVRVAVEGYIGSELLGGVVAEMLIPYNVNKSNAHLTTFLPLVDR